MSPSIGVRFPAGVVEVCPGGGGGVEAKRSFPSAHWITAVWQAVEAALKVPVGGGIIFPWIWLQIASVRPKAGAILATAVVSVSVKVMVCHPPALQVADGAEQGMAVSTL